MLLWNIYGFRPDSFWCCGFRSRGSGSRGLWCYTLTTTQRNDPSLALLASRSRARYEARCFGMFLAALLKRHAALGFLSRIHIEAHRFDPADALNFPAAVFAQPARIFPSMTGCN